MKKCSLLPMLSIFFLCSGCASIISDNETFTQVETNPEKAECTVSGYNYRTIIKSPANIILPSNASPITITCQADGFDSADKQIVATMDGSIFGNILFGGLVGVAIDAARGAGKTFPKTVYLALNKKNFSSIEERDSWYSVREKEVLAEIEEARAKLERNYPEVTSKDTYSINAAGNPLQERETQLKKFEEYKLTELSRLENAKNSSIIIPQPPSSQTTIQE